MNFVCFSALFSQEHLILIINSWSLTSQSYTGAMRDGIVEDSHVLANWGSVTCTYI